MGIYGYMHDPIDMTVLIQREGKHGEYQCTYVASLRVWWT